MTFPIRPLGIAIVLMLSACASTAPARFYTLSTPNEPATSPAQRTSPLFVEIMPVRVPERLARPQIVVRTADAGQVRILERDRWSSHFDYELHDALASAITANLGAIDTSRSGQPAESRSYRIAVELAQFDAVPDDHLQTRFSWSIKRSDDGKAAICQTATTQAISNGIGGVVQSMQQAVNKAAQEISASITALEAGNDAACDYVPQ